MKEFIDITVRDLQGQLHTLQAPTNMGLNLMELIRLHELPIQATCGGMAMCASCHIQVLSNHVLPEMGEAEEAMLDEAFVLDMPGSRLSCQIPLREELDGLKCQLGALTAG